jgi:hypothetical protein
MSFFWLSNSRIHCRIRQRKYFFDAAQTGVPKKIRANYRSSTEANSYTCLNSRIFLLFSHEPRHSALDSAMDDHTSFLWLAVVPVILIGQVYVLGVRMSKPERMLRPIKQGLSAAQEAALLRYKDWLASVGLEFRTSFQFGSIRVAVFQQGNQPRFFSFMFHQRLTYCAESYLDDLTCLDTCTSGDLGLFPRPGSYAQSFPNLSPEEAWDRHLEGEAHLSRRFGYVWVPLTKLYEDIMLEAIRLRMRHNRGQSLWPLRVLYRYAVMRKRLANRTIAEQFPLTR